MNKSFLVSGIISLLFTATPAYALDVTPPYISLPNSSSDNITIDNPGSLFRVSLRNDDTPATTTLMSVQSGSNILIGDMINGTDSGSSNLVLGNNAFTNGGTGGTAIGHMSLRQLNGGAWNNAFGGQAGSDLGSGTGNTFMGNSSATTGNFHALWSGDKNLILGFGAADNINESGSVSLNNNIIIGAEAAANQSLGSGDFNIVIGSEANLPLDSGSYQLNIGNMIFGTNVSGTNYTISPGKTGIGSTTPSGRFSIQANNGELNDLLFTIGSSTESDNTTLYSIDNVGHHIYGGPIPTLSSCGSSPTNVGTDSRGRITIGTGSVTSCELTFVNPWANAPVCTISQETGTPTNIIVSPSNTSVTITAGSSIDGDVFSYSCDGF